VFKNVEMTEIWNVFGTSEEWVLRLGYGLDNKGMGFFSSVK